MKLTAIKDTWLLRIFDILLVAVVVSFPYSRKASSWLSIGLAIIWLLLGNYRNLKDLFRDRYFLMFSLLFFIPLLSLVYSEHKDFSLFEKRLFLLIYPLIICSSKITHSTIRMILTSFAISCTCAAVYVLGITMWHNEELGTKMTFAHLGITHVYFGLYLSFSVLFIIYLLITKTTHTYRSALQLVQIIFLLLFLFALGAKMSIISLLILICMISIYFIIKQKRWIIGMLVILIPAVVFTFTLRHFEVMYWRFYDLFDTNNYFVGDNAWNSIGVRVSILTCTYDIYKTAPLLGTGIGDVQRDLDRCYEDHGLTTLVEMNTHNQFLQFALGTGIISLIILLLVFFALIRKAWLLKNKIFLGFMFIFLFCCLTEALLERQYGTMAFGFFAPLLFYMRYDRNKQQL